MILTPIAETDMASALTVFAANLQDRAAAHAAFRRIAATWPVTGGVDTPRQRAEGVALTHAHGVATLDEPPSASFMWDGEVIRTEVEATVIVHELAHWLLAAPERRPLIDFGLGPGPETTRRKEARAHKRLSFEECMDEERLTSLLGILWEAELGHPAILAFLEQNWMEGWERPATAHWFADHIDRLLAAGLIDVDGRPATARAFADAFAAEKAQCKSGASV
ncbi:MAG TPA: hypothetical protein PKZ97_03440 [Azospirillaceae bacterium]|nr:hypothetical protein [Azospirillaceae bacterium]HRQ80148.1 hypothetical protein [Azospirillaceae bacterium]